MTLPRFETELLAWVIAWAPYGGAPDDETFPEFGLSSSEVAERVTRLVCSRLSGKVPTPQADRVLIARAWMALPSDSTAVDKRRAMHSAALHALRSA